MLNILDVFGSPLMIQVGWALLHFLWQGVLVAAIASGGLRSLRHASSHQRYLFLLTMFGILTVLPPLTFWLTESPDMVLAEAVSPKQPPSEAYQAQPESQLAPQFETIPEVSVSTLNSVAVPIVMEQSQQSGFTGGHSQRIPGFLVVVWAGGVCLLSLRLILGWIMMTRVRRTGISAIQMPIQTMCTSLCLSMSVRNTVQVFESVIVQVPAVVGWLRPLILLPTRIVTGLSDEELRAILAHELAHIRRHDYLVNLGQIVVENLLFYHPVVWWLSSRIRQERENCCDDIAAQTCGSRVTIARALATLAEINARIPAMLPAATGGSLIQRIRRLLQSDAQPERFNCSGIAIGILCLIVPLIVASCLVVSAAGSVETDDAQTQISENVSEKQAEVPSEVQEEKPGRSTEPTSEDAKPPIPFDELHRIPEGRVLHRVPLPITPEARKRYEAAVGAERIEARSDDPDGRIWRYDGKTTTLGTSLFGGPDDMNPMFLVDSLTGTTMCELEGDPALWLKGTGSDFVIRDGATTEQIVADLEYILNEELNFNATLKFEDVERDVYVVKGRFDAKPAGPELRIGPKPQPTYLLYGKTRGKEPHEMDDMGKYPEFWKAVSLRVGRRIVDESENAPDDFMQWLVSYDNPETTVWNSIPPKQFSANSEMVLNRISEQTGLTFEKARRTVRVLSLKPKQAPAKVIRVKPSTDVRLASQFGPPQRAAQQAEAAAAAKSMLMKINGRQMAADDREAEVQAEQLELSKDWSLTFPAEVQQNELAGVIVDEKGQPLHGAKVDLYPAFTGHETTTDEKGIFRYKFENAGKDQTVEVRFSKDGYSPIYRRNQSLGVADLRIILSSKTYLEGMVVDKNDKPVSTAIVVAAHPYIWRGDYPSFNRESRTSTDENGRYRLYLNPEVYAVIVLSEGHGVERVSNIEVLKNEAQTLDLQLNDGVNFRARVLDADTNEPVAGFTLYHRTNAMARGVSNAEGLIEIPNSLPGDEEFQVGSGTPAMGPGYYSCPTEPFGSWWSPDAKKPWHRMSTTEVGILFELSPAMDPVTIYVRSGVLISGKVIDPDGNPVAQATVAPARTGTGNSLTGDTRYSVETKEDGSYVVCLPPSGDAEYNLMAHDGKYSQWRKFASGVTEPFRTKPGQRLENVDIQLHRPATVRGRVTASDGRSLKGLAVRAHAADKLGNRYYDPTTKTNEDGTFEVTHIRPGEHFIQVEPFWLNAEDAPPQSSVVVEVTAGEIEEGIELAVGEK